MIMERYRNLSILLDKFMLSKDEELKNRRQVIFYLFRNYSGIGYTDFYVLVVIACLSGYATGKYLSYGRKLH